MGDPSIRLSIWQSRFELRRILEKNRAAGGLELANNSSKLGGFQFKAEPPWVPVLFLAHQLLEGGAGGNDGARLTVLMRPPLTGSFDRVDTGNRDDRRNLRKPNREDPVGMSTATKKNSQVTIKPLGDRVVVRREAAEAVTAGGIVLPDSAKDKPARGTIISIGDGRFLEDGSRSEFQVAVGDQVLFSSFAGDAIEVNDEELLLMYESDILAVVEG
jgi:chaperonin GroES